MPSIPRERSIESTLAFLADPYRFISRRCRKHGTDLFEARLLLQKSICMSGPEAAELFYDQSLFRRQGAMPGAIVKTLFGKGGVQGLDGDAHQDRKKMLMAELMPEAAGEAAEKEAIAGLKPRLRTSGRASARR